MSDFEYVGFSPKWRSPPGDTIEELLDEHGLTLIDFAKKMDFSIDFAERLISGDEILSNDIAVNLEVLFRAPASFWINRERHFRG